MHTPAGWAILALSAFSWIYPTLSRNISPRQVELDTAAIHRRQADGPNLDVPSLLATASRSDVDRARAIVKAAIAQTSAHNKARLEKPARNQYSPYPGSRSQAQFSARGENPPPLFNVTEDIAKAAALVAEADAWAESKNGTVRSAKNQAQAGNFWLGQISHSGGWPFGKNGPDYKVFRDVTKYGAKGDGVTFIGNANDRPIIKAAPSFVGLGVISTDKYVDNGGTGPDGNAKEWFINTANFYRQIRNFIIDITDTKQDAYVAALHYQVAQATSLQFVEFRVSTASGTTQQSIFAENGSGGFMSDLVFNGGAFGIYGGNQQFTAQRLTFNNVRTAVQLVWDWGWTWKSIQINNCGTGFKLISENGVSNTGSVMVVDSVFRNVDTAVLTFPATLEVAKGSTGVTLDNVKFDNVNKGVVDTNGKVYLPGNRGSVDTWVLGRSYLDQKQSGSLINEFKTKREGSLLGLNRLGLPKAPYFERTKPQYTSATVGDFIHMRDFCKGDGVTDDTACFQSTLNNYAGSKYIYIDAGSYILTNTIRVPRNAKIVGENWSQLVAKGRNFEDAKAPRPLLRVGEQGGERGTVEMQDLIFTSVGPTAGVVFVEWNIRANGPGEAGMWDCHVRVGGAVGTDLESYQCPAVTSGTNQNCNAGSLLMHVTKQASGYFENVWLWVADHDLDDPDLKNDNNTLTQCSVYVARGLLIESTAASWYYGTASEHAVFYQYALQGAKNVHMGMIQTEEPYYQPNPAPPEPFNDAVGLFPGDPPYNGGAGEPRDAGWGLRIKNSSQISVHGAGLYSWFSNYKQDCLQTVSCQDRMVKLEGNHGNVRMYNLVTIGSRVMIDSDGLLINAKDNQAVDFHPRWSQIAVYDPVQFRKYRRTNERRDVNSVLPEVILKDAPSGTQGVMWFALVNGTPYTMRLTGKHSYQMGRWDSAWTNVPPGESLQVYVEFAYDGGTRIHHRDDAGEAYYELEGTDKKFYVRARVDKNADSKWIVEVVHTNLPTRDVKAGETVRLPVPPTTGYGKSVQWVLTGSERYGYWTTRPPVTWMKSTLDIIGDRKLKHICMPGSHDAGISKIDGKTPLSTPDNTQTQMLDMYGQLVRGSRWFDIRPCLGNGGKHMLCHYGQISGGTHQGGNGQSVQEAIDNINKFMDDHPGELVILDINDESGYDTDNPDSGGRYSRLTDAQWQPIITQFSQGIKQPCPDMGSDLANVKLKSFIGNGKGCVLSLIRINTKPGKAQYPASALPRYNIYSNIDSLDTMARDQVAKLKANRVLGAETDTTKTKDGFFILSWTLTGIRWPIQSMAAMAFNHLFTYAFSEFTPFSYPNVLYVDYLGAPYQVSRDGTQEERLQRTTADIVSLALAVNLQLASQNGYVGGGKIEG
ncbi:hypothetical protein PRK78_005432 [Emydomyces testavorans]|uniref:Rhamnogalacturonase A/B/Epimerase-like pectate lyase domain-containing protein n=1 Tax=Emydomyces testavorans TaxID=2070801 RepID=A0AAF0IJI1_9EURO|nr:hypothetical protein PRK78_005432 [Emydomyces testavorans]